jgi:hypothetical protein
LVCCRLACAHRAYAGRAPGSPTDLDCWPGLTFRCIGPGAAGSVCLNGTVAGGCSRPVSFGVMRWRKPAIIAALGLTGLGALTFGLSGRGGYTIEFLPDRDQKVAGLRFVTLRLKGSTPLGEYSFREHRPVELLVAGQWREPQGPDGLADGPWTQDPELTFAVPPQVHSCRVHLVYQKHPLQTQAENLCERVGLRNRLSDWLVEHLPERPRRPKSLSATVIIPPPAHNAVEWTPGARSVRLPGVCGPAPLTASVGRTRAVTNRYTFRSSQTGCG